MVCITPKMIHEFTKANVQHRGVIFYVTNRAIRLGRFFRDTISSSAQITREVCLSCRCCGDWIDVATVPASRLCLNPSTPSKCSSVSVWTTHLIQSPQHSCTIAVYKPCIKKEVRGLWQYFESRRCGHLLARAFAFIVQVQSGIFIAVR